MAGYVTRMIAAFASGVLFLFKCHICVAREEERKVHSQSVFNPLADIFLLLSSKVIYTIPVVQPEE